MAEDEWAAGAFADAQARAVADLTPTERVLLLEQLLELAAARGALQRSREAEQREIDATWAEN